MRKGLARACAGTRADGAMFGNRHGHDTVAGLELILRAAGMRPHPGWGCGW